MLTLSQRRAWARRGDAEIQRTIDAAKAELAEAAELERAATRTAYAKRTAPVDYTPAELAAATHVRTATGWHKVVRVSAKSVTVETGYSWTDRHPLNRILEVRTIKTSE